MNNSPDTNTTRDDDNAESSEDPGNFSSTVEVFMGEGFTGGLHFP